MQPIGILKRDVVGFVLSSLFVGVIAYAYLLGEANIFLKAVAAIVGFVLVYFNTVYSFQRLEFHDEMVLHVRPFYFADKLCVRYTDIGLASVHRGRYIFIYVSTSQKERYNRIRFQINVKKNAEVIELLKRKGVEVRIS